MEGRAYTYKVPLEGGQDRLRQMVLYVSQRNDNAPYFGLTKLNKTIWRADFAAYRQRGKPVTGRAYQRLQYGPAAKEMLPLLRDMRRAGDIGERPTGFGYGVVEHRPIALKSADLNLFDAEDIGYVDDAIDYYWHKTGRETSDESHGIAWRTRHDGDPMPYECAFISDKKITGKQLDRIKNLADEMNLQSL